jgi:hypothetical protein
MPPEHILPAATIDVPAPSTPPTPIPPLAMGKFAASKAIVWQSGAILWKDKEMLWFPVLSALACLVASIVFGILCYMTAYDGAVAQNSVDYALLLAFYIAMYFIVNFFQAGIFIIAHKRFGGEDVSFSDGFRGAVAHSGAIFVWSAISATVGFILRLIADRSELIGRIVAAVLGAAWNIMTYFSLPSIVIGERSVSDSFRESAAMIRKSWGETIIVNLGVGLFFFLIHLLTLACAIGIVVLFPTPTVVVGIILLYLVAVILLSVVSSTLSAIFKLALYDYARTGIAPEGFSPELIGNALIVRN